MTDRPPVTTHILDLVNGAPAAGIKVRLSTAGEIIAAGITNEDGRVGDWDRTFDIPAGKYCLEFAVEPWFKAQGKKSFYEDVQISFRVESSDEHYHVPLLLSPFGYSTYRGS